MKKHTERSCFRAALALLAAATLLASCGKSKKPTAFADGTYTGKSSVFEADESGNGAGYGEAEITVKDNKIIACTFKLYEPDGTLKDENYGAGLSQENRLKAQKAVQAADRYAEAAVAAGSADGVDAISGATLSYNEFIEAVNDALSKAAQ